MQFWSIITGTEIFVKRSKPKLITNAKYKIYLTLIISNVLHKPQDTNYTYTIPRCRTQHSILCSSSFPSPRHTNTLQVSPQNPPGFSTIGNQKKPLLPQSYVICHKLLISRPSSWIYGVLVLRVTFERFSFPLSVLFVHKSL